MTGQNLMRGSFKTVLTRGILIKNASS